MASEWKLTNTQQCDLILQREISEVWYVLGPVHECHQLPVHCLVGRIGMLVITGVVRRLRTKLHLGVSCQLRIQDQLHRHLAVGTRRALHFHLAFLFRTLPLLLHRCTATPQQWTLEVDSKRVTECLCAGTHLLTYAETDNNLKT